MSILYIVGTPIGNLEDVTFRAIRILKESDIIACEDTRVTKRLLDRYEIRDKKLVTFNEQKSGVRLEKIIEFLEEGKEVAYVSDAGTPGISDPAATLVAATRSVGFAVIPIPGASALTATLSVSGIKDSDFLFLGFLPHKKGRETLFKEIADSKRTIVFYESTHRLMKTLEKLKEILDKNRKIVIGKELTKIHEEVFSGSAAEIIEKFKTDKLKEKGEFVVVVEGC